VTGNRSFVWPQDTAGTRGALFLSPCAMAAEEPGSEVCAGYLDKKTRSVFSGWQQRYFVLLREQGARSATLKYWDTDKSYRERPGDARGEISMRVNPDEALARRVAGAQPTMHMQLPGRLWEFRSKHDRQITKWLEAFKHLSEEAAHSAKAARRKAMAQEKVRDVEDIFKRPVGETVLKCALDLPICGANRGHKH
jgi:hypothetical protein